MIWEELAFDRMIDDNELISAFSQLFAIPSDAVCVIETLDDAPLPSDATVRLLLQRWTGGGEFPLHVTVFPREVVMPDDTLAAVKRLAAQLDSACLIGDESPSLFTWLRIRPDGIVERVRVENDALERDEFVGILDRSAPSGQPAPLAPTSPGCGSCG